MRMDWLQGLQEGAAVRAENTWKLISGMYIEAEDGGRQTYPGNFNFRDQDCNLRTPYTAALRLK